jgi:hypothetical protein
MTPFKILIFEDETGWVNGFEFNLSPKCKAEGLKLIFNHRINDSTLMQDLEWLPDLILVDHDLGTQVGSDIISQIDGDPQYRSISIYYYSGGESIESLREYAAEFKGAVYCYIKEGDELENAVLGKGRQLL